MSKGSGIKVNSLISTLLSRVGIAGALGMQFGGKRDLYAVFGYKTTLTYLDFYNKYKRQDIARRINNAPAAATWRNPPKITGPQAYVKRWEALAEEHTLWGQIERADRLAGLGNYSVMLLGLPGAMESPARGGDIWYVQPYSQAAAEIIEVEEEPTSPRFGLPKTYLIKTTDPLSGILAGSNVTGSIKSRSFANKEFKVHYSRIVHIAEDVLDSNFLGTPRLEAVYNLLDDLIKVAGGTAETYWLTGNRGMQVDIDKDAELTTDDANALADEIEEYQHQLRRVIRTRGVKINNLGADVPDPKNTFDMLLTLISGTSGIPKRILVGSEAGQLASDQDRANWADTIKERRTKFAEPQVLNPLQIALMNAGVLPKTSITKIGYEWPLNFQLTPLEEAQSRAQQARAAANLDKIFADAEDAPVLMTAKEARIMLGLPETPKAGTLPKRKPKEVNTPFGGGGNDPAEEEEDKKAQLEDEGAKK